MDNKTLETLLAYSENQYRLRLASNDAAVPLLNTP